MPAWKNKIALACVLLAIVVGFEMMGKIYLVYEYLVTHNWVIMAGITWMRFEVDKQHKFTGTFKKKNAFLTLLREYAVPIFS